MKRVTADLAPPPRRLRQHFRTLLSSSWGEFRESFKRCRTKFSESSVHQLRVESRRLQALLGLLETLVGQEPIAPAHRRVKKVLRRFARLRDTQVLRLQVEQKLRTYPEAKVFRNALREREQRLIRKVGGRIRRVRLGEIKAGIAAADREGRRVLAEEGRQAQHWKELLGVLGQTVARVVFLRERCRTDDVQTIHRLRIGFKRFRYTIELLQPVLPGVTKSEIHKLRAVQNRLGAIQDADVLLAAIDKFTQDKPHGCSEEVPRRRRSPP